jgi:hypothetical protein
VHLATFVQPFIDGGGGGGGACGAVTFDGTCQGGILSFCEEGELFSYDCGMCGLTCGCEDGWCDCMFDGQLDFNCL